MFGSRERFVYDECAACTSIQICQIPAANEMARHYPPNYYSFDLREPEPTTIKARLRRERDKAELGMSSVLGSLSAKIKPSYRPLNRMLALAHLRRSSRVLDVGCGSAGEFIDWLRLRGIDSVTGCDPFIGRDTVTTHGSNILKRELAEMTGSFDLVTFHHSLEHHPDPAAALGSARKLLSGVGYCLVRIPTPTSELWKRYNVDWVEFDAPRHFHLISRDGFKVMSERMGFRFIAMIDDMEGWTIHASEEYQKGIPLCQLQPATPDREQQYVAEAARLNTLSQASRTGFVLAV